MAWTMTHTWADTVLHFKHDFNKGRKKKGELEVEAPGSPHPSRGKKVEGTASFLHPSLLFYVLLILLSPLDLSHEETKYSALSEFPSNWQYDGLFHLHYIILILQPIRVGAIYSLLT